MLFQDSDEHQYDVNSLAADAVILMDEYHYNELEGLLG